MPEHTTTGPYVEEVSYRPLAISPAPAGDAAFVGVTSTGPRAPTLVQSADALDRAYGSSLSLLLDAARAFFANGGRRLWIARAPEKGRARIAVALTALQHHDTIGLVAAPGVSGAADALVANAAAHRRFALIDGEAASTIRELSALRARLESPWAAIHHPWPEVVAGHLVPPSGFVAGIYARVDATRGLSKPAANEVVEGVVGVAAFADAAAVSAQGINLIRRLPQKGFRLWGARTTSSDPEWKYVHVRRYLAFVERSIDEGLRWAVFEPNDEGLWAKVRLTVGDFLYAQWHAGALLGTKPAEAYFVKCDSSTMTQADVDAGRLNCVVGCAFFKPAEFQIMRLTVQTARP